MGKSSNSSSSSTTQNTMGNTNTSNPFYQTITKDDGTVTTKFQNGTAAKTIYNKVNKNIGSLLNNYLKPNLNNVTDQARLRQFNKTMDETAQNTLQNNILNPLISNNMIRSSQATNMYNNMQNQMNDSIADYTDKLLADSQNNSWNMINNLANLYSQAYQGASANQNTGINAAFGNNKSYTSSNSNAK